MADRVNEVLNSDDKKGLDIINLLFLGWILLGLIVYILGNVIATQLKKRKLKNFANSKPEASKVGCGEAVENSALTDSDEVIFESENLIYCDSNRTTSLIPVCEGDDNHTVQWINKLLAWLYNQKIVSPIVDPWISALNAKTRLSSTEHGILIDIQNLVYTLTPPVLKDCIESFSPDGTVNINCFAEFRDLKFKVLVTQVIDSDKKNFDFLLDLKRIAGQLTFCCIPEDLNFIGKFSEPPQVQLQLEPVSYLPPEQEQLHSLVCEITTHAVSSCEVPLKFNAFPDCPKFELLESDITKTTANTVECEKEEKLQVKILYASNIGGDRGCQRPYCVVEMDDPPQKYKTSISELRNPHWEETFVFVIKHINSELLFEVYDQDSQDNDNFLGLCIVSGEELIKNPNQTQEMLLEPRPMEKDNVSGSLTVEFMFLGWDTPVVQEQNMIAKTNGILEPGKTIEKNSRITAGGSIITTTTIKRTCEGDNGPEHKDVNVSISESRLKFLNDLLLGPDLSNFEDLEQDMKTIELHANNEQCSTENDVFEINANTQNVLDFEMAKTDHSTVESNLKEDIVTKEDSLNIENNETKEQSNSIEPVAVMHELVHEQINKQKLTNLETNLHDSENCMTALHKDDICSSASTVVDDLIGNDDTELTNMALRELEKHGKPGPTSKSTLIIHSVQRVKMDRSGKWQEVPEVESPNESLEASPSSQPSIESSTTGQMYSPPTKERNGIDRSRPKEKKSLIKNLRKKLSFRKPRSKSFDEPVPEESPVASRQGNRSISSERVKLSSSSRESASVKSARRFLAVPGSSRSSFSEASGLSTESCRTYINENSRLVIEINENGILKRYLIPTSMIHRSKWKKKGIKLHLYNDHVFVARHISSSVCCQVCKKHLPRRPGKQGYECRDCHLQCHKSCHVKVVDFCPNSSVPAMEVEYIHDPKSSSPPHI